VKTFKYFLLAILIYYGAILFAQERSDYIGTWERTTNTVMGYEINEKATLNINEDGTFKWVSNDFQNDGTWEVDSTGDLRLNREANPNATDESNKVNEYYSISKDKEKITYNFFVVVTGKITTAKELKWISVYSKLKE